MLVTQWSHYREKMSKNWNFPLWVRPKEPFSRNGKLFSESYHKECAVWIFIGEANLDLHTPFPVFPFRLCTKLVAWKPPQAFFYHQNRFPFLQIGVLRHPTNGFDRLSVVFSV